MLFSKNNDSINTDHIDVKLKNWGPLKPELYLAIIFWFLMAVLSFVIFVLPGFNNYGSQLAVTTTPSGSSVYIDGIRIGSTPLKTFVKAGEHSLTLQKPYYTPQEQTITVKGRRLFSAVFPKKMKLNTVMPVENLGSVLQYAYGETSKWILTPYNQAFPRPKLLLDTATDLVEQWPSFSAAEQTLILRWAQDIFALASDEQSFKEILDVWTLFNKQGLPINLNVLTNKDFSSKNINFSDLLQDLASQHLTEGSVVTNVVQNDIFNNMRSQPTRTFNGITFRYAEGGSYVMGNQTEFQRRANYEYYPHNVTLNGFYYSPKLITETQLAAFIKAFNVKDDASYNRASRGNQSAKYVTYDMARVFCEALSLSLQQSNVPLEARLISEAEWEYLARQNLLDIDGYEWMTDSYFPYRYALYPDKALLYNHFSSNAKVVRGYAREVNTLMKINERGSQLFDTASPYTGFRVVLVPVSR